MTTPYGYGAGQAPPPSAPAQYVMNGNQPIPIIQQSTQPQSYLLANTDEQSNIYISTSSSIVPVGSNVFTISPLGTISLSSAQQWWACSDTNATPALSILPGGTNWAPSPSDIADVISPLAAEIAIQIAQTGVSLLAAPTLLYNFQSISPGTPGPVGATIVGPNYNLPGSQTDAAITTWNTNVARTATCGKVFYQDSTTWPTSIDNKLQPYLDNNMTAYICLQPAFNPPKASDKTALTNFLTMIKTAGLNAVIILWQELGRPSGMTSTLFTAMTQFYSSTVRALYPLAIVYDSTIGCGTAAASWFSGPNNTFVDLILQDLYASSFPGLKADQPGGSMSVADANGLPFGFSEIGSQAGTAPLPSQSTVTAYLQYILSVMSTRLGAAKTNDAVMWWNGGGPTSAGNVPLFPNDVIQANDFRAPLLQQIFDTLTQQSSGGTNVTIGAGAGVNMTPLTPSPGGGYASATAMSYDLTLRLTTSTGSTNPFVSVILTWYNTDSTSTEAVQTVTWHVPVGATGTTGALIVGRGPMRGQFMKVRLVNRDSVTVTVNELQINGTGRTIEGDNWYWEASGSSAIPGFTLPGAGPAYSNTLGSIPNTSIPASGSKTWLLSMFSGQVWVRCGAATTQMEFSLVPQPTSQFSTAPIAHEQINQQGPGGENEFTAIMFFPRGPVLLTLTNDDGTAAHNASAEFIPLN